ncbi:ESX-1 secretion-associated protein [Mycobacterium botniense]|uniref:ESX-1 secretion-associated protein n=1 Tax=Mycobacterium botniense TaxID=84962 RepID=A0A7I9XVG0_9MYCO|nr:ESX-1 secretion-associated protein [Mycobacterium botniense]GFG73737.1 hypothetical protein MBOT_11020 [Mycobacterium botniense]
MADHIHVVPANLREAAGHHEEASDYLRSIPAAHAAIQESLDSLGPIFSGLREAGRELLEQRRQCYERQAEAHAEMAHNLRVAADAWEHHDEQAAAKMTHLRTDHR